MTSVPANAWAGMHSAWLAQRMSSVTQLALVSSAVLLADKLESETQEANRVGQ